MLRTACIAVVLACSPILVSAATPTGQQKFPASSGGALDLQLEAGADVEITGSGESAIGVTYSASCTPECEVGFKATANGLKITTRFKEGRSKQNSNIGLVIQVPSRFDVILKSAGGSLSITGVEGKFTGETSGGELNLRDVRGTAELSTMGGEIRLTDSELDGSLKTMGGEVLLENVVGDVRGSSMGGNVRYKNVRSRGGHPISPARSGDGLDDVDPDTVQISTMGGEIDVEDASEGADLHTMGGNIHVKGARRFVRAKTMGGDIEIDSVDGWVQATTMGGDIDVQVVGAGGDVTLTSMSGDIELSVPAGMGMNLDLEIAFTRNSQKDFRIEAPGSLDETVTPDWDHGHGTPRKYIRSSGPVNGGGHSVTIRTVNGNITIRPAS